MTGKEWYDAVQSMESIERIGWCVPSGFPRYIYVDFNHGEERKLLIYEKDTMEVFPWYRVFSILILINKVNEILNIPKKYVIDDHGKIYQYGIHGIKDDDGLSLNLVDRLNILMRKVEKENKKKRTTKDISLQDLKGVVDEQTIQTMADNFSGHRIFIPKKKSVLQFDSIEDRNRYIWNMFYISGFSYAEIADRMDLTKDHIRHILREMIQSRNHP